MDRVARKLDHQEHMRKNIKLVRLQSDETRESWMNIQTMKCDKDLKNHRKKIKNLCTELSERKESWETRRHQHEQELRRDEMQRLR